MLLLALPITAAYTIHATRASTRSSRLPNLKMNLKMTPSPSAEPPPEVAVSQHRRIDPRMLHPAVASKGVVVSKPEESSGAADEALEAIFLLHADGPVPVLKPGTAMYQASQDLAKSYPAMLMGLDDDALVGRLFQFLDEDGDGVLEVHEWVHGITQVLNKSTPTAAALNDRIAQANAAVPTVHDFSKVKKVGIIGAGVAGLQAANELRKAGLEVKVFEKSVGVAGVWRANYADFGLQVPRDLYEFPGYPYPDAKMKEISGKGFSKFPEGHEVADYIRMFADDMELQQLISFETSVTRLEPIAGGDGWVMHHGKQGEAEVVEQFDFVVVATGMYSSGHVHLPEVEGMDRFQGQIMHSTQFKDASVCQGKNVVVVGGGKSSIDCVVAAAKKGAKAASMVFRTAHWPVPRKLLNLVPFQWGTYSRFGHFMFACHYNVSPLWKYVHGVLAPLKWLWWRIVATMFRVQFGLKGDLLPESRIELDVFGGGQVLNYDFRDMLKRKQLHAIKGSIASFDEHGVTLEDGTRLDADIVVYGTGFGKSYEYLDRLLQNRLRIDKDGLFLYRNILPTGLANVAFVGGEVSTFNNILTQVSVVVVSNLVVRQSGRQSGSQAVSESVSELRDPRQPGPCSVLDIACDNPLPLLTYYTDTRRGCRRSGSSGCYAASSRCRPAARWSAQSRPSRFLVRYLA